MEIPVSRNLATNALAHMASQLIADAAEYGTRFGSGAKVYLATVPGVDLGDPECVSLLDELRRAGLVRFERCDYVAGADADLLAQSEWLVAGTNASLHFLCVA